MIAAGTRVLVCSAPQDMRRSFDRLAEIVRQLGEDPQSGTIYVFVGKRPTRLKLLWWDGTGLCLLYKRLNRAIFRLPNTSSTSDLMSIDLGALKVLLSGVPETEKIVRRKNLH